MPWLKDLLEHSNNGGLDIYSTMQCYYLIHALQDIQNLLQCNDDTDNNIIQSCIQKGNNKKSDDNLYDNSKVKVKTKSYDVFPDLKKMYGFQILLSIIENDTVNQVSSIWFPMLKTSSTKSISFYYKQLCSIYQYINNIKLLIRYHLLRAEVILPCVWNIIVLQSGAAMIKLLTSINEQVCYVMIYDMM